MDKLDKIREAKDIIRKLLDYEKMSGTDTDTSLHGRAEAFLDEDTPKEGCEGGKHLFPPDSIETWGTCYCGEIPYAYPGVPTSHMKNIKFNEDGVPVSKDSPTQEALENHTIYLDDEIINSFRKDGWIKFPKPIKKLTWKVHNFKPTQEELAKQFQDYKDADVSEYFIPQELDRCRELLLAHEALAAKRAEPHLKEAKKHVEDTPDECRCAWCGFELSPKDHPEHKSGFCIACLKKKIGEETEPSGEKKDTPASQSEKQECGVCGSPNPASLGGKKGCTRCPREQECTCNPHHYNKWGQIHEKNCPIYLLHKPESTATDVLRKRETTYPQSPSQRIDEIAEEILHKEYENSNKKLPFLAKKAKHEKYQVQAMKIYLDEVL